MILNGNIKTTSVHPFYSDGNWVEAGDLSIGDKILHVDGLAISNVRTACFTYDAIIYSYN